MDVDLFRKTILIVLIMVLFNFYYVYYRVTMLARKRMEPWKRAMKKVRW